MLRLSVGARALPPGVDFIDRVRTLNCVTTCSLLRPPPSPLVSARPFLCGSLLPSFCGGRATVTVALHRSTKSDGWSASRFDPIVVPEQQLEFGVAISDPGLRKDLLDAVLEPLKLEPVFASSRPSWNSLSEWLKIWLRSTPAWSCFVESPILWVVLITFLRLLYCLSILSTGLALRFSHFGSSFDETVHMLDSSRCLQHIGERNGENDPDDRVSVRLSLAVAMLRVWVGTWSPEREG